MDVPDDFELHSKTHAALGAVASYLHVSRAKGVYIVLGTTACLLLSIGLGFYIHWKRREYHIKRDVLKLTRGKVVAHAGRNGELLTAPLLLFRHVTHFLDLFYKRAGSKGTNHGKTISYRP